MFDSKVKNRLSLVILSCIASLNGCSLRSDKPNGIASQRDIALAQGKPKVVASHNVLCDLVETIAEDTVDLTCLIDGGRDSHTYRPTPAQRKMMEEAQLILYGGYQLEPQIIQLVEATETSAPKIAVYEQVVAEPILSEEEHLEEHSAEAKPELEPDPHVWHTVENTVAAVELIQPILLQLNPSAAEQYLQNTVSLTETLWNLDAWIDEQIATIPEGKRILVTTHDSFNYYVKAYYFEDYHSLQGLSSQSSPTASEVKNLATEIRQIGVPTIFVESTKSDRVMNNVARAANVELSPTKLYADGLAEADNYIEMMSHNTCAIVNGLGGECQTFEE